MPCSSRSEVPQVSPTSVHPQYLPTTAATIPSMWRPRIKRRDRNTVGLVFLGDVRLGRPRTAATGPRAYRGRNRTGQGNRDWRFPARFCGVLRAVARSTGRVDVGGPTDENTIDRQHRPVLPSELPKISETLDPRLMVHTTSTWNGDSTCCVPSSMQSTGHFSSGQADPVRGPRLPPFPMRDSLPEPPCPRSQSSAWRVRNRW